MIAKLTARNKIATLQESGVWETTDTVWGLVLNSIFSPLKQEEPHPMYLPGFGQEQARKAATFYGGTLQFRQGGVPLPEGTVY